MYATRRVSCLQGKLLAMVSAAAWIVLLALVALVSSTPSLDIAREGLSGTAFPVKHFVLNLDLPPQERCKIFVPPPSFQLTRKRQGKGSSLRTSKDA